MKTSGTSEKETRISTSLLFPCSPRAKEPKMPRSYTWYFLTISALCSFRTAAASSMFLTACLTAVFYQFSFAFVEEYLKELEKIGILKGHKIGRENLYLNVQLYELLSQLYVDAVDII